MSKNSKTLDGKIKSVGPLPTAGMTAAEVRAAFIRHGATYPDATGQTTTAQAAAVKRRASKPGYYDRMAMVKAAKAIPKAPDENGGGM